ncbi:MAG: F0F1 ATP synthase subunit gamma, partial [Sphingomonas sp.]
MASLKALKIRIGSVKSTQKITKAMQMVAAAKLRRAQSAAEAGRPYAERIEQVVANLARKVTITSTTPRLLTGTGRDDTHLLIVATSERGLAGAFNANIVRAARRKAESLIAQGKTVKILTVGKKGRVMRRFYPKNIVGDVDMGGIKNVAFTDAQAVAAEVLRRFEAGEFDVAHLFYAKFQSALV